MKQLLNWLSFEYVFGLLFFFKNYWFSLKNIFILFLLPSLLLMFLLLLNLLKLYFLLQIWLRLMSLNTLLIQLIYFLSLLMLVLNSLLLWIPCRRVNLLRILRRLLVIYLLTVLILRWCFLYWLYLWLLWNFLHILILNFGLLIIAWMQELALNRLLSLKRHPTKL